MFPDAHGRNGVIVAMFSLLLHIKGKRQRSTVLTLIYW